MMLCDAAREGKVSVASAEQEAGKRPAVTLDDVRLHRRQIIAIARRFGVRNVRVFGSVARGEATGSSDLDLLIDVEPGHGYFDMTAFALAVEDLLGVFTQVATEGGLKLRIRDGVLAEAVPV
jgi:predicted nucleotidyltransferase